MTATDIRAKSGQDLQVELDSLIQNQSELIARSTTSELKTVHKFGQIKKRIAQIKTILRERQLKGNEERHG